VCLYSFIHCFRFALLFTHFPDRLSVAIADNYEISSAYYSFFYAWVRSKEIANRIVNRPQKPKNSTSAAGYSGTARAGPGFDIAIAADLSAEVR